jgi:ABC-type multidrug transport system fused ATPase/permease subunit
LNTIKKLLKLISPHERKRAALLLGMTFLMALLDMVGIASIMPFLAILANPELLNSNRFLNTLYVNSKLSDPYHFIFLVGVLMFAILLFAQTFKAITTYAQLHFTLMREFSISKRLVEAYLRQPYEWFLERHSADLGKSVLSEVGNVIQGSAIPLLTLISQSAVTMCILIMLLIVDPILSLIIALVLGSAYGIIFQLATRFLRRIGDKRVEVNQLRFRSVSEAFGAFKEIKVRGREQHYVERFAAHAHTYAKYHSFGSAVSQLPRFALELLAFGGILLVVLRLIADKGNLPEAIPIIALFAFSGYRLMPALQSIYASLTQLRFSGSALDALYEEFTEFKSTGALTNDKPLALHYRIALEGVSYRYPNKEHPALQSISLEVPRKSIVGLVGATGSGKSTLVDIILGLLTPQTGVIKVDGIPIEENNRRAWRNSIGYVPQQIYLTDDTIMANIGFGLDTKDINQCAVERAAKIACIDDFVKNDLPDGYETRVGDRGIRLSGGQRQRIGIARALYFNPSILILDEATSSLDNLTEQEVMRALHDLNEDITIIMIAHRLTTVKNCDLIFFLENGELKSQGSYETLSKINEKFRAMTQIS